MLAIDFQNAVLAWYEIHGRKDLPWQQYPTHYRVWISEVMLQQTQVAMVIPYYNQFIATFPDVNALASAPLDRVLHLWAGLGYYARARNLHKTAQLIAEHGKFPDTLEELCALPGIGRSTAGAILSIAFKSGAPILDGNVKRVFCRFYGIEGWPGDTKVNAELWRISARHTPQTDAANYTQAIMDLGATLCTRSRPQCGGCPLQQNCIALRNGLSEQLPTPKPPKALPIKRSVFLLATNKNREALEVLLERRPASGIWGGLWSLPQFEEDRTALEWCAARLGTVSKFTLLPERRHSFSHYHLDYAPLLACIENPRKNVMESNRPVWYKTSEIATLGLPAPVKRLLEQIENYEDYE